MILKNALVVDERFQTIRADLGIQNGLIADIGELHGEDELDLT